MIDLSKKLDNQFSVSFPTDLEQFLPILPFQYTGSCTLLDPYKSLVFKPITQNLFAYAAVGNNDARGAAFRCVIPYAEAERMALSNAIFNFYMAQFLNQGLIEITNTIGTLAGRKPTFTGFIHSVEYAGYEFRIFVDKI